MALVDLHYSWLVLNSIVGCTNGCKYCFLNNRNHCLPKIYGVPEDVVKALLNYKYYHSSIPLCLFPNTDIFLNKQNVDYLLSILNLLCHNHIVNDLVIITKCLIPEKVLEVIKKMEENGHRIVFYVSYSGLSKDIELGVHHQNIFQNFQLLQNYEIPFIHYYRPFLPDNSCPKEMEKLLNFVHQFTSVSVVNGYMFDPNSRKQVEFWKDLEQIDLSNYSRFSSIWPESSWNYFKHQYNIVGHNVYQTNLCALSYIMKKSCIIYYNSEDCLHFNHCDAEQRKRCEEDFIHKKGEDILGILNHYLGKLGIIDKYTFNLNEDGSIELFGSPLSSQVLTYLSLLMKRRIYMLNGLGLNDIYYSSLNGAQPLILRRGKNE